jgi:glycosyltransferase involved in cell wall biosynthesis
MKILKIQSLVEPRGYKLVRAMVASKNVEILKAIYSRRLYSGLYSEYAEGSFFIGPSILKESRFTKMINVFNNQIFWPQSHVVARRMKRLAKANGSDLVHTNGFPDSLGVVAKRYSGLPVVHEIYDTYSLQDFFDPRDRQICRKNNPLSIETTLGLHRHALRCEEFVHKKCDALVFTSEEMRDASLEKYGDFKSVIVPNGVLKEFLPTNKKGKLSNKDGKVHCVYLGAIDVSLSIRMILTQIHMIANSDDIILHLYPVIRGMRENEVLKNEFLSKKNVIFHSPLHYQRLYEEISQYDLGLVILNPRDEGLLNTALPNKIFEYVATGLPCAVPDYQSLRNFVRKHNCGFIVNDWSKDILQNLSMIKPVPFHDEFTIDYFIPRLIDLYRSII